MKILLVLRIIFWATTITVGQSTPDHILGEWVSPSKDSRVQIYQQGGRYFGKITWGTGGPSTDERNPDPTLRIRSLIGLVILKDFSYDGKGTWGNGTIYDPREGKTYACKITLDGKNNLRIRGYIGVSLFGRTEVWTRFP